MPHFYVSMDIEIDALLKLRERAERQVARRTDRRAFHLSVNDFVIKAAAADAAPRAGGERELDR